MVFFGVNISVSLPSFLSSANAILGGGTSMTTGGGNGLGNANGGITRPNPLYDNIQTENWDMALQILQRSAANSRPSSKPRRAGNDGLLPLHMLCWLGAGRRQDAGVSNNGSDSDDSDNEENTPRSKETEIQFQKCQEVLDALLEVYPSAAKRKDNLWGWTPLHMACYSARSSVITVRKLIAIHPSACSIRDEQRLVPLHRACLMASDDILEIVRVLLLADPSQVNVEIRNGERDVPFHLLVARIHHEIQKERFKPLRIQKDYGLAKSSTAGYSIRRNSNTSSSSDDETDEDIANRNTWPFHEPHSQLEQLIEATFLVLEAEERGSIGNGYLTKHRMVELVNGCLRNCRCPNQRLFAYMALWDHPELVTMSMDTSGELNDEGSSSDSNSTGGIMLHVAAGHAKHSIKDCHWCAACNRGLADPHFVSQDNGESCDLTCAYRKCSIDEADATTETNTEEGEQTEQTQDGENNNNDGGSRTQRRTSWYLRYKDRMYKDVVLTIPYGCILKQIANLYPQAAETKTDDGSLPLHLAIRNGHTWIPGIQAIYRSYPAAGSVRDASTGLYPYQLAAAKKPQPEDDEEWDRKRYLSELTTTFELLRADPDVILKN